MDHSGLFSASGAVLEVQARALVPGDEDSGFGPSAALFSSFFLLSDGGAFAQFDRRPIDAAAIVGRPSCVVQLLTQ